MALDRRITTDTFRIRLSEALTRLGVSRAEFARRAGIDRSTLTQLLSSDNVRLPRADTVASIATALNISTDWLLGLSQQTERSAEILQESIQVEVGAAMPTDHRLRTWYEEAVGYKIRHVPTTLPHLIQTDEVLSYEYRDYQAKDPTQVIAASQEQLGYTRLPETDMEVCCSAQVIEEFTRGEGIWRDLPDAARQRQLDTMIRLTEELYPTFRWYLYDGLTCFSVPLTIFGPLRAAVYMGQAYFVYTTSEHIRVLIQLFDGLIRAAVVQPPDVPTFLRTLRTDTFGK